MKNTTKLAALAVIALTTFFSLNVSAQTTTANNFRIGIGLEAGAPTGNAQSYLSSFELGGTIRAQMGLSNNLAVIVTSGYYNMFNKNITVNGATIKSPGLGIIPLKGGIKGFLGKGIYFTGEAGAGFETSKDDNTNQKDTKLILSPGLGYATHHYDVSIRYESFTGQGFNYGLVGLRLAYGI